MYEVTFSYGYIIFITQTPGILSPKEFKTFWIRTASEKNKFSISVGKGGETDPFMSHSWNNQEHDIKYIGFSSWTGHSGDWKILPHDLPVATKDFSYKYYYADIIGPEAGKHQKLLL